MANGYYIPRNAGEKTYDLISTPSATTRPWIAWSWAHTDRGNEQPANDVYAVVRVDRASIRVAAYRAGDSSAPIDQFTVTQSQLTTPTVGGTAEAGSMLTASVSAVPASADLTYEWLRDGTVVRPASADRTYLVQPADAGHQLTVRAVGTARRMTAATAVSAPVQVDPVVRVWASFGQDAWETADAAATLTSTVSSSCRSWTVTDDSSWLTETPTSGTADGRITVSAAANTGTAPRTGTVTVKGCGSSGTLTVVQGPRAQLSVGSTSWAAPVLGGQGTVAVTTNQAAWKASVPASAAAWLAVTPSGGAGDPLVLTAQPNSASARSTVVTVTSGSASRTVTVSQAVPTLAVSASSWAPSRSGASRAFQVQASVGSWELDPASLPAWVTVDRLWGSHGDWFVLRANRNLGQARSATVAITSAGVRRTVTVSQATASADSVSVSSSSWTAAPGAGARAVSVTTNGRQWHASADQGWVHLGRTDGASEALLVVGTDPNPGTTTRTARITVTAGTATRTVTVTQQARGTGAAHAALEPVPAAGGSLGVTTGLTGQLSVSDDAGWLTSAVSGGSLTFQAAANTGEARSAQVTVSVAGAVAATYVVVQEGPPSISTGGATWAVSADGGSQQRTVTAARWSIDGASPVAASSSAPWLRVPSGPQDSGTLLGIAADPNSTGAARTATVVITTSTGGQAAITVTQPGR